mmetsp:Transcript_49890/g.126866  ORF Transcript_49890/g.126866 Transcript_49890/m.126866 type:complete len:268 (-) Transcript_49890:1110-1913(-)
MLENAQASATATATSPCPATRWACPAAAPRPSPCAASSARAARSRAWRSRAPTRRLHTLYRRTASGPRGPRGAIAATAAAVVREAAVVKSRLSRGMEDPLASHCTRRSWELATPKFARRRPTTCARRLGMPLQWQGRQAWPRPPRAAPGRRRAPMADGVVGALGSLAPLPAGRASSCATAGRKWSPPIAAALWLALNTSSGSAPLATPRPRPAPAPRAAISCRLRGSSSRPAASRSPSRSARSASGRSGASAAPPVTTATECAGATW